MAPYHPLRMNGIPELRSIGWLDNAPRPGRPPDCLEFLLAYPAGRYGGVRYTCLRVPVPEAARAQGLSAYRHFAPALEKRRAKGAIALRNPRRTYQITAALFGVGPCRRRRGRGHDSDRSEPRGICRHDRGLSDAGRHLHRRFLSALVGGMTFLLRWKEGKDGERRLNHRTERNDLMRNPARKLGYALIALCTGALLFWLAISERLGPEESAPTMGAGVIGFTLLLASAYFVPVSLLAAQGRARLLAGTDVIARWPVGAADWERYCAGARTWSRFTPRRRDHATGVEIIAGKRSVLIDDCYFRVDPGKKDWHAECRVGGERVRLQFVITIGVVSRVASTGSYSTKRSRLLLPVPASAPWRRATGCCASINALIAGVEDLGDLGAARSAGVCPANIQGLVAAS